MTLSAREAGRSIDWNNFGGETRLFAFGKHREGKETALLNEWVAGHQLPTATPATALCVYGALLRTTLDGWL